MRRPLFVLSLVFAAAVYLFLSLYPPDSGGYASCDKERAKVCGTVYAKEIRLSGDGTETLKLTLHDASGVLLSGESPVPAIPHGILVTLSTEDTAADTLDERIPIGSQIVVTGKLYSCRRASNPGEFDSSLYYRILKVDLTMTDASVVSVSGDRLTLSDILYRCKKRLEAVLDEFLPAEDADIMKACLMGDKGYLSQDLKDLYSDSGIIHVMAISGLHISLFGMGLYRILRRIHSPRLLSALLSAVFILLYADMVRLSGTGIRAVLMFLVYLGAELLNRSYDLLTAMALSLILLLISEPSYILYSGFQFSFLAVLGIGILLPLYRSRILKITAIPAAMLPATLGAYGTFPLWSVLLNIAVIPLMSVIMVCGIALCLAGAAVHPLGLVCALPIRLLLYFYRSAAEITQQLPFHRLVTGQPTGAGIVVYYTLLAGTYILTEQRRVRREKEYPEWKKGLWLFAAIFVLTCHDRSGLSLDFMDVGQGDGILIEADGAFITIDGGSSTRTDVGKYVLMPFLNAKGADHIDIAVLTHDDTDHCSGLIYLLENGCDIREIMLADMGTLPMEERGENYNRIAELAAERGIPVVYIRRGETLRAGRLALYCIHPSEEKNYTDDVNQDSVTFLLTYGQFSALLTGDLEQQGEEDCLAWARQQEREGKLPAINNLTVLKCGHHGSKYATSAEWLSFWNPKISVISCGTGNRYHHPAEETLERLGEAGTKIEDTRYDGEIEFRTDGKTVIFRRFLAEKDGGESGL